MSVQRYAIRYVVLNMTDRIVEKFRAIEHAAQQAACGNMDIDKAIERIDELLSDICEEQMS